MHDEPHYQPAERAHGNEPATAPGVAVAEAGIVMLDGFNGVAMAMTGAAAIETGKRLIEAGEEAMRQISMRDT